MSAAIIKAMLKYSPCPRMDKAASQPNFKGWKLSPKAVRLLKADPNAFLMGALFDRMMRYKEAWEAPVLLRARLRHLDVFKISHMHPGDLAKVIGKSKSRKSLVRFPNIMARTLVSACQRLVNQYDGDASKIWGSQPKAAHVLRRLSEFEGISQKIANMTVRLLVTSYGVSLTGWDRIDVAVDRHVARVFLRTGLVPPTTNSQQQRIVSIKDAIINKARALVPKYPGALDEPAFEIGRWWCTAKIAYCDDSEEPCPLTKVCPKLTRFAVV